MSNDNKSTIKISMIIAMLLLLFMLCLQSATAVDITNSTAGGISKGISDTSDGGTLVLANGFYEVNNITIDKNLTIKGTSKSGTILNSDVPFNVLNGNTLTLYNLTINSNYLYTDEEIANYNNNIHNSNGSINGPGNVVFENCLFINNLQTDATVIVTASSTYDTRRANFTATVKDSTGSPLTGDVVFYVNNKFSGRVSAINGIAIHNVDLANGNYVVHAAYIGNFYAGPWGHPIGQTSLININPKISQNQLSFSVNSTGFILLGAPLPTTNKYYVDPLNGQDVGTRDGLTIANAWRTIQYAYTTAPANSSIILQPGTYTGTGNVGLTNTVITNKFNMTIIGNDTNSDVIIDPRTATGTTTYFMNIAAGTSATNLRTINLYNMKIIGAGTATVTGGLIQVGNYNYLNIDSLEFYNISNTRAVYAGESTSTGLAVTINANNTKFINMTYTGFSGLAFELGGSAANPSSLYINNSYFERFNSNSNGGLIRNNGGTGIIEIYNSNFDNIYAGAHGGVFCINGPHLILDNTNFTNCWSPGGGGVIYAHNTVVTNISNSNFKDNRATSSGSGGVIYTAVASTFNINNCTFINNSAGSYGGVIAVYMTTGTAIINIHNSTLENNTAGTYGGAIGAGTTTTTGTIRITVDNSSHFRDNSAGTYGGAVATASAASGTVTINITTAFFQNNKATSYGGAIGASSGTITVNNSNFRGNYVSGSDVYGGALGTPGGTIRAYNSEFFNNSARNNTATASSYGGAAGVNGNTALIELFNCTIRGNWAKYGGAFGAGSSGGTINVINSPAIYGNYALEYGGVVGLSNTGTITLTNCTNMYNNSAGTYGGVFGVMGGTINVYDSVIRDNSAGTFGGVVGVNGNTGTVNLYNSYMYDNIAVTFGGAIGATGGTVNVRNNSSLSRNRVTGPNSYGGAIGLQSGNINVYDGLFENNAAVGYGGAVGVSSTGNFYANSSVFINNTAGTYGGALGSGAGVHIEFCNFTSNRAGTYGGAVAAMAPTGAVNSNVNRIYSCQFEYNRADISGNAIYAANYLTANYNRFFNNTDASGSLSNSLWTNTSQPSVAYTNYYGVNIDFNWWGENTPLSVGRTPNNYFIVNVTNPDLYNGSAHYTYTIGLAGTNTSGFNVSRLPAFYGDIHFTVPLVDSLRNFTAHANGTVITLPFNSTATQVGYFQVDNQILNFTVRTNTTPNATNLTVNLAGTSGKYKDNVILNATFTDSYGFAIAGLNITFWVDGKEIGSNLTDSNGYVTHNYTIASAGNLTYTAVYNGNNPNYNARNGSTILEFFKLNTNITVNGYVNGTGGTPIGLNVTIYDEKGRLVDQGVIIYFYQLNGPLYGSNITNNASQAILYYTFPTSGNYTWYAYFNGTGNYTTSNSTSNTINGIGRAEINVILTNTTVNNASGVATVPVTINGTVYDANGLPLNGTVNITINGTSFHPNINVTNGRYNLTIVWNVSGNYTIFVQYNGNNTYNRSNATGRLDIALMPTNTTVTNSSGTASTNTTITGTVFADNGVGINGTVNVTITAPNGSSFTVNNVNVTNGQYSLTVVLNSTGNYTVRAVYGGNLTYRNSSSPGAGFDGRIVITAMGSNATVNNPSSIATESVNINGTLRDPSGVNINGNVTVTLIGPSGTHTFNNVPVVNGLYAFNATMNVSGLYNITVTYLGDNTYGSSTARGVLTVSLMPTSVSVNNPTGNATNPVNINGTLLDKNGNRVNGTVNITVGGSTYVVNLTNGNYNLTVTLGANGTYPILVQYFGNGTYAGSINNTGNLYIAYMSSNTIVSNATGIATVPVIINGTVKDANGNNITGLVNITITGPGGPYTFNNVNVTNGRYTLNVTMGSEGLYTIFVDYRGNATYSGSNATGTLNISTMASGTTVNSPTVKATNPTTITGTVSNGVNGTVDIRINGTLYAVVNVTNGVYSFDITWNVSGVYTIFVNYAGNATFNGSNATGLLTVELMPTNTTVTNGTGVASENTTITGTVLDENNVGITGTVNVTVTGPSGSFTINNVNVTNGLYSLTVVLNSTGNYTVTAVYGGNLTYRNSSSRGAGFDGRIVITAMGSNATVNNPSSIATESVNINGTLRDPSGVNITGNVTVTLIGPSGTHTFNNVPVVNGLYAFNATMNVSGLYNITVTYLGDNTYGSSTARGVLTVSLMPTSVSVNNPTGNATNPVNINGTLLDKNGNRVNGTVNITVGGTIHTVALVNGDYNLSVIIGASGTYPILVQYLGNGTYAASSNSTGTLTIGHLSTNTTVNSPNGTAAVPVNINGTVYDNNGVPVNGTVNITVDGITYPNVPVVNGAYNLTVTIGSEGNYTVLVQYGGNGTYYPSNATGTLTIGSMTSGTTVNNVTAKATNPVTITGTVSSGLPVNGFVNITINGTLYANVPVVNGVYVLNVTWNVSGNYTVFVQYAGNATFNGSNATGWLNIELMPTNTSVTNISGTASDPTTITGTVYDENSVPITGIVNITIDGPGGPFTFNNVNVINGLFNLTVVLNTTGNYTVRAAYGGNLTYRNSSSRGAGFDGRIVITAMGSNATVNNPSSIATESVNINGTLRDPSGVNITGNVTVTLIGPSGTHTFNNVSVVNGQYNLTVTMNVSGLYNITVTYLGDDTYGSSTARGVLTVSLMPTSVSVNNPTGNATNPVNINGTLLDDNGNRVNGTVNITVDGTTHTVNLINGEYNLTVIIGASGTYPILVQYLGNGTYAASSNSTGTLTIGHLSTNTTVNSPNGTAAVPVNINGTVYDDNNVPVNGTVNITVDGVTYVVNLTNGEYNLNVTIGSEGNYTVLVVYGGNETYTGSNATSILTIGTMPSGTVVNNATAKATNPVLITGTVSSGLPVNGFVNITINGTLYANVPVVNGVYVLNVTWNVSGVYDVFVVYGGNATFNGSNASGWLNITLMPTDTSITNVNGTASDPVTITGKVLDENGVPINDVVNITISGPGGPYIFNNVPVVNGTFTLNVTFNTTGNYSVFVEYGGNATYAGSISRALDGLISISAMASNTTVNNPSGKATDNITINGTVTDKNGTLINGTVNITVDGKTYNVTVTDGEYSLNVTVDTAGNYPVTVYYPGDDTYGPSVVYTTLTVEKMPSITIVEGNDTYPGVPTTINGTVTDENGVPLDGSVYIYVNGVYDQVVTAVGGLFNGTISGSKFTGTGNFTITAVYGGNSTYANSSGSNIVIANQIVTTVTVNDSRGRTTETITINGTVDNAYFPINGVVRVIITHTLFGSENYTAQVINGAYSLSVVYNRTANYTVQVIYDGDANYTNSNNSAGLHVDIMPTTTTVVNNETRPRVEFSSPLVADLIDDNGKAIAGATVLFKVDGISVGSNVTNAQGRAVFWTSLTQFPVNGTYHNISAEYLGNLTYNASTHSDNILASYMNVTIIIVTPPDTKPGDEVNVTIIIVDEFEHPANDTNITVQIGNDTYNLTTDPNGTVVIPDISSDIATDIPLVVDFVNNSRYNNNTENATLVVEKFNTTIQLGNVELTTLNRTVFSITLVTERGTPIANDEVEIFIDGVSIGKFKTDKEGKIYINHTAYPVGSYEIKAVYSGDEFLYHPTTSVSTLNVRLVKTTITVHRVTSHEDAKTLFVAILVDEFDNPVAFKTISFMVNGMVIGTAMTDANGRAMISYYTYSGDYEVFAEFLEDSIYAGSIDYRTFGVNLMSNETLNETNQTNETLNETNETNTTGKNTPKPVDNNGSDPSDDPDPITLNEELVKSEPAPVGAQMLNTGNPIAILALCLLSILWIGFRRRRKKD